jgi:hypothetical protein
MKVIWICAGDEDFALAGAQNLDKLLMEHNIKHSFTTTAAFTSGRSGATRWINSRRYYFDS